MVNIRNKLLVAVHHASGGSARIRTGGAAVSMEGESSGSFRVVGGTRYRLCYSCRGLGGLILLVGYTNPVVLENASTVLLDFGVYEDDVPEGTYVYFATLSPSDLTSHDGAAGDMVYASFYG